MSVCTRCGGFLAVDDANCPKCGVTESSATAITPRADEPVRVLVEAKERVVNPWARYWARTLDFNLFSLVFGFLVGAFYPDFVLGMNPFLLGIIVLFNWVFVEASLLSILGTTPGKWLFRTDLRMKSGLPISWGTAFERSFTVWWKGMGIGFPIAALITNSLAYTRLTNQKQTSWDEELGFEVTHNTIGPLRISVAILFFAFFVYLIVVNNMAQAQAELAR